MGKLDGKVAIITGGGSGIGRASVRRFAAEGAKVVVADFSGNEDEAAAELGEDAVAVHVDVSKAEDIKRMIEMAVSTFGKLDVLFNNAGFSGPHVPLDQIDDDVMDSLYGTNLKGVLMGIKYAIPAMRANGGGSIINTSSATGLVGRKDASVYGAMKGGVCALTMTAALEYAADNIRVNSICPGMTFTGLAGADAAGRTPVPNRKMPVPMQRWGHPGELAAAALFLASDDSSYITGVNLPVDGGYVAE